MRDKISIPYAHKGRKNLLSARETMFILTALFMIIYPGEAVCADNYKLMAKKFSSAAKAHKITRIAVIPFSLPNQNLSPEGRVVSERLITQLVKLGEVEVAERNLLKDVMREQWLTATGAFIQAPTDKPGRLIPADAIITGSILTGAGICEINARMIETETGIILAAYKAEVADTLSIPAISASSFETPVVSPPPPAYLPEADICRDSSEIDTLDRSIVGLKARYWAGKIKTAGFSHSSFALSSGAGIVNPKIKAQFYDLLEAWHTKTEIPGLSLGELTGLLETEEKILRLIKSCNGTEVKT
ncbi:MAG: hypothetical protein A2X34_05810 [Elusimicrobia bacterium GWC2_51_8]|nr:MAG: hypothetical protein A2X33_03420 [Elusimicrobia bacterium GWA2_51_34]OGR58569.1 MAG: hypothetical protein A2X34_05810 [Elusimicrobia bacterium GWC2_51_8]OGR87440.1 MAG: hypothetical protein A2021_04675 [Elusimicrobia bacterium GWF2_52_66]HAF95607.1 hypothetical protein [Elusimicrobiota bacterium]HCE98297.1 hypothetical protein [Elusimicrobiota bacterium]